MEINSEQQHPIFTTDPAEWIQYLYKEVCVTTELGSSHTGWVYTVDPVSQSVVLVRFGPDEETKPTLEVVLGHAIQSIVVLDDNVNKNKHRLEYLFRPKKADVLSPEEMKQKQEKLKLWLLKNRLPVKVTGNNSELLSVTDALVIEPPYEYDNCQSTNEIILGRIQGLIKNMPKDVEDW